MPLKQDFIDMLKQYKRLPFTQTEKALEMLRFEDRATAVASEN